MNFPEPHPFLVSVFLRIFANEGAFQYTLEAEEEICLIFNRRHDDGAEPYVFAGKAVGEDLVTKHCGFGMGHAHGLHSALKRACKRLFAVGVGVNAKIPAKKLYARGVIVGYKCRLDAVFPEHAKPI